ncbi:MAG: hypothetical protein IT202_06800 [Fimbriimonadaceae bacterium]|nr:hypothetical protein [Fimbriimonadaceae bacterium]MCC6352200.1 hypothetical protein [Fimbriimonadaceae bacterium]QOJ11921.1 MAG: hypothetical protein HRU74_07615 [Chthonomonadaceae bacterium]
MRSHISREFRAALRALPKEVQSQARKTYELWKQNPHHPGLHFARLKAHDAYSVRIGLHYRAICVEVEKDVFLWDWIGSHSDYDKLVDSL